MVGGECVLTGVVHGEHTHHTSQSLQGNGQGRLQGCIFFWIGAVTRFHLGVSVDDGFAILGNPPAQALAYANFQRRQKFKILSAYQLRQQPAVAVNVYGNGVVMNQFAQAHRQHGQGFTEAQRISQVLAQLEHGLGLLPCGSDRSQKVRFDRRRLG